VAERWNRLDMLVLNAAMLGTLAPVPAIDGKEFNKVLTLNLLAQQALIAAFDPLLRNSGDAQLVAVTSSVGRNPRAYWGAYGASKAALEALVLSYAEEVRSFGIRAAIVDPGATATTMRVRAFPGEDPTTIKSPAVVGDAIKNLLVSDFETGHRMRIDPK
jgi:NAD(P)-dependent dehydrogenase (short-subunit alcohol dehydrogenase family)